MVPPVAAAALEQVERRANPQGQAEQVPEGRLALWNFAIGRDERKPEHDATFRAFVRVRVASDLASRTAAGATNDPLAVRRAETMVRWLNAVELTDDEVGSEQLAAALVDWKRTCGG